VDLVVARGRLWAHELVNAVLAVLDAVAALRMRHVAAVEALKLAVVETSTRTVVAVRLRTGDEKSGDNCNEQSLHGFSFAGRKFGELRVVTLQPNDLHGERKENTKIGPKE